MPRHCELLNARFQRLVADGLALAVDIRKALATMATAQAEIGGFHVSQAITAAKLFGILHHRQGDKPVKAPLSFQR